MSWGELVTLLAVVILAYGVVPGLIRRAAERRANQERPPQAAANWVPFALAAMLVVAVTIKSGLFQGASPLRVSLFVLLGVVVLVSFARGMRKLQ